MQKYMTAEEAASQAGILKPPVKDPDKEETARRYSKTLDTIFSEIDSASKKKKTHILLEDVDDIILSEDGSYLDDLRNMEHDSGNAYRRMRRLGYTNQADTIEDINQTIFKLYESLMKEAINEIAAFLDYKGFNVKVYTDEYYGLGIEWAI